MEGDATAMYLQPRLQSLGVKVTRLARGLPVGGDLEYADPSTVMRALMGRQEMDSGQNQWIISSSACDNHFLKMRGGKKA